MCRRELSQAFTEDLAWTARRTTEEAPQLENNGECASNAGQVHESALVLAVHFARSAIAEGTVRREGGRLHQYPIRVGGGRSLDFDVENPQIGRELEQGW